MLCKFFVLLSKNGDCGGLNVEGLVMVDIGVVLTEAVVSDTMADSGGDEKIDIFISHTSIITFPTTIRLAKPSIMMF